MNIITNQQKAGFSLIELLIGMGLVGILLATANVLLFSSLKSAKKAEAQGITKSEGAFALNSMSQVIKYAREIESCSDTSLQLRRLNNHVVRYFLSGSKIASAGSTPDSSIDVDLTSIQVQVEECDGQPMFSCQSDLHAVDICYTVIRTGSTSVDDSAELRFNTSVSLRNIDN